MKEFRNIYGVSHIDFATSAKILKKSVIAVDCVTAEEIKALSLRKRAKAILCRSIADASALHRHLSKIFPNQVYLVCMSVKWAEYAKIQVLDSNIDGETDPFKKIPSASAPTLIPAITIDEDIIAAEVERIQQLQIMSHYSTYGYSIPKRDRPELQEQFMAWLRGEISTEEFAKRENSEPLKLLVAFMSSPRGKQYQKLFPALLRGEEVEHDFPSFEVTYFRKIQTRPEEADGKKK